MDNQFTPGQYVRVRATIHEPWQVRIFVGWNERRPGSGAVPYARVMLRDGFQFDKDAATESFSMIEPWVPEIAQWAWILYDKHEIGWVSTKIDTEWHRLISLYGMSYGSVLAPLTLPPFVAVGDKY